MAELFLELFGEEIPARMQVGAEARLLEMVTKGLNDLGLGGGASASWSGPRRIAVSVKDVAARQADLNEERRGPRADAPEQAIAGFLKGAGISRDEAETRSTPKGDFLFAVINKPGRDAKAVIPEMIAEILADFAWPKSMRWGRSTKRWVRPLQRVSVIFDGAALEGSFDLGGGQMISFGATSLGHRIISPKEIPLITGDAYEKALAEHAVIASRAKREEMITSAMAGLAEAEGLDVREDKGLMAEVTGLVEYPHPIMGRIDDAFMALPPEILIVSMRSHQKYFAVQNKNGSLAPYFVTIGNMTPDDERDAMIRKGNERVLRARLADADFFWGQDKAAPLADNVSRLEGITFFEGLGTMGDKAERLGKLTAVITGMIGASETDASRAGLLAKADLVSETVGEFPELQGIIGGYLARSDEGHDVADAIAGHYKPEGPADAVPNAPLTMAVALADKIDTLVGFFGVGAIPTGSKDPYALRRAALGVIRIIIENNLKLSLMPLFDAAAKTYGHDKVAESLMPFMVDRLKVWMRDHGIRHDVVAAVLRPDDMKHDVAGDDLSHLFAMAKAVDALLKTEDGQGLMAGYRRASNILTAEEKKDGHVYDGRVEAGHFASSEEQVLFDQVGAIAAMPSATTEEATACLSALGAMRGPIDQFFENNTVNDDDPSVRENRLNLLGQIRDIMQKFADFAVIEQ